MRISAGSFFSPNRGSTRQPFVGREMDERFFAELPADCDACGENGEFHSFVYQAPGWSAAVPFSRGEIVLKDSFLYCDLLPRSLTPTKTVQ